MLGSFYVASTPTPREQGRTDFRLFHTRTFLQASSCSFSVTLDKNWSFLGTLSLGQDRNGTRGCVGMASCICCGEGVNARTCTNEWDLRDVLLTLMPVLSLGSVA